MAGIVSPKYALPTCNSSCFLSFNSICCIAISESSLLDSFKSAEAIPVIIELFHSIVSIEIDNKKSCIRHYTMPKQDITNVFFQPLILQN